MWCKHPGFQSVVESIWTLSVHLSGMMKLNEKLKRLKQRLKQWNREVFGDIFQYLKDVEVAVADAEEKYDDDPSDANLIKMNHVTALLQRALVFEKDYWSHRASGWFKENESPATFTL